MAQLCGVSHGPRQGTSAVCAPCSAHTALLPFPSPFPLWELRTGSYPDTYIYQFINGYVRKDTDEQREGMGSEARVCGKGQGLSRPLLGAPPSWHLHVFPYLEASQAPSFWDFMEATSHRHDQSLTPLSAPSLLKRMWGEKALGLDRHLQWIRSL